MNTIISIFVAVILGLLGITKVQSTKLKNQKKDLEESNNLVKERNKELEVICEAQNKIKKVKTENKPKKKKTAKSGNSSNRIDRLNKLHDN